VKCSAVTGDKLGCTEKGIYGWLAEVRLSLQQLGVLNWCVQWRVFMVR